MISLSGSYGKNCKLKKMHINWNSPDTDVLLNSRLPAEEQQRIHALLQRFPLEGHLWLSTSGSTGIAKWAALSKKAVLASAEAVNAHLQSTSKDRWINPLPSFHVGGLGIWARAFLSGASVVELASWDPVQFHQQACAQQVTLTALVPTQLYDLIVMALPAPVSLRAAVIGGGAMQESLYRKAIALGWNPLPSYGLTECSSQVATAALGSNNPTLQLLPHMQVKITPEGFIAIKSDALLTGYVLDTPDGGCFWLPKVDGWFLTEDRGALVNDCLTVHGRNSAFIKIGGESVDLLRLENLLEEIKLDLKLQVDVALVAMPDERLGSVIHLAATAGPIQPLIDRYQGAVLPFERIRAVHTLPELPRTPLGKLNHAQLVRLCTVAK